MNRTIEVTIDSRGRLVIPEAVSERLHLVDGVTLVVEKTDEEGAHLVVRERGSVLKEKEGVLVAQGEVDGDIAAVLHSVRQQRIASLY